MLDHTTIHVGVTREVVEKMKRTKRVVGMVSLSGSLKIRWAGVITMTFS